MAQGQSANAYIATLAQALSAGGSETTFYVSKITTLTGETVATGTFAIFGKGAITIDPLSSTNIEFASFTGVDSTNIAFTGGSRGLSAFDYTSSTTRAKYHPVGTTVIIAFGAHNLLDLVNYVATTLSGFTGTATNLVAGSTKLSVAAVSGSNPIAVGQNDPAMPTTTTNSYLTSIAGYLLNYYPDTGVANAYAITPSPAISSYVAGQTFIFKAANANTTASTLNVNALGTKSIKKNGSVALVSGDIASGQDVVVVYDGTNFQMVSLLGNPAFSTAGSGTVSKDISSNTTTTIAHGLGLIPKLVKVTGTFANTTTICYAISVITGGTTTSNTVSASNGTGTSSAVDTTFNLRSAFSGGTSDSLVGTLTVDGTNITITWSKQGSPTGTANLLWEATG